MQELENILEEIKEMLEDNKVFDLNSDGTLDKCIIDVQLAWNDIKDIICKHMSDKDSNVPTDDGWKKERKSFQKGAITMTENEALKILESEVVILDCWIENDKDIIANCDTEDDEFEDDKELAELSLKDYSERKELFETAISALKEIQQYREIGTVEEFRKLKERSSDNE